MKTINEHNKLIHALETAARTMQGCWVAFMDAGHFGAAMMAEAEAKERNDMARLIVQHLMINRQSVTFKALAAPPCDYVMPIDAIRAMCKADMYSINIAEKLYTTILGINEYPGVIRDLLGKMNNEYREIRNIMSKFSAVASEEDMAELNLYLSGKYSAGREQE